jgi:hypothetical protein
MVDFNDLKEMIADAKRAMDAPKDLTEIQEVSAALFFALGIYIDDLNDRLARLEPAAHKSLIIGA